MLKVTASLLETDEINLDAEDEAIDLDLDETSDETSLDEVKPEKPLLTLLTFPDINTTVLTERMLESGTAILDKVFTAYIDAVSVNLNPKAKARVLNKLNRIKASRLKSMSTILEGYAIDISEVDPNLSKA